MIRYISQDDFIPSERIDPISVLADPFRMLRLREVRRSKKMTQEALASEIGTSQSNISEIEKGIHNPTLETLSKIATALKVGIGELFEDNTRDEVIERFLSAYEQMDIEKRVKIVELAELMAGPPTQQ